MSIKRIDADLGFLSLPVAEITDTGSPVCQDHHSADGMRLRELLHTPAHEHAGDIPMVPDAQDGRAEFDQASGLAQRLTWLAGLLRLADLSHEGLHEESLFLHLPANLLKDSTLALTKTQDMLAFELRIGDAATRAWVCDKLVELVDMLAFRIAHPFTIRIVDAVLPSVVAEAGMESGNHPWHRTSSCEN